MHFLLRTRLLWEKENIVCARHESGSQENHKCRGRGFSEYSLPIPSSPIHSWASGHYCLTMNTFVTASHNYTKSESIFNGVGWRNLLLKKKKKKKDFFFFYLVAACVVFQYTFYCNNYAALWAVLI